jgi:putative proteasome-type protease
VIALTYCLGILLPSGLVFASDSRSNAGIDQVTHVRKMAFFSVPETRTIVILSAGNLATSQAVVSLLEQAAGGGDAKRDIHAVDSQFDVAAIVGEMLREVIDHDGKYVAPFGDDTASFLVGGQIRGEPPRLFQVYSAGNFVEASDRTPFLQIGETKYGKPILDRALTADSNLDQAAKLALLSFDATVRSNLSVGPPIDLLRYEANSFSLANLVTIEAQNNYWRDLRQRYSDGLIALVRDLPPPPAAS